MYIKTTILAFVILFAGCAAHHEPSHGKKAEKGSEDYLGENGIKEYETDPAVVLRRTNKVKCQEARMDMVDAESKRDEGEIRLVKARLQKYCIADE
ncbi:hypothetical protein [Paraglaciecola sp. 2405UD69-4]|uniref:hypothetical protein n=1 Tax=Paraglaciecola sp. 2405UD69-4 TaxID=3391836 RepID=UPI0039C9AE13